MARGTAGRGTHRGARRRPRRRRGPRVRRRHDVHAVRRARLPALRRRGQGRPADAAGRRPARADRGVRRRGDREADPHARPGRAHRRARASPTASRRSPAPPSTARPLVVLGGRAPAFRWGTGALQELDHPPLLAPVTKLAATVRHVDQVGRAGRARPSRVASAAAPRPGLPRRPDGPALQPGRRRRARRRAAPAAPDARRRRARRRSPSCSASAAHPVLVLGSDVWADGAEDAARRLAETAGVPVIANGMGRGILPAGHPLLVTRARSAGVRPGRPRRRRRHPAGLPARLRRLRRPRRRARRREGRAPRRLRRAAGRRTSTLAGAAAGDLTLVLDGLAAAWTRLVRRPTYDRLGRRPARPAPTRRSPRDAADLAHDSDPVHPARIYGELRAAPRRRRGGHRRRRRLRLLRRASTSSRRRPGGWLDPGPYGCLGHRPRLRDRRPAGPALGAGRAAARRRRGRASR